MHGYQQQVPDGVFVNRTIAHHHEVLLMYWDMTDSTGAVIGVGASYGVVADDGLASMTDFYEQ